MSGYSRREWLTRVSLGVGAGMLGGAGNSAARAADEPAPRPNIVFILADDLGYGDLGCYGQTRVQTPHIDKLAAEGVKFTQCYAGSTVCAPSRCALMTGLHTGHCHIRGNARVPLRPEDVTVAEVLNEAGYATALIGKWGLGNEDTTGHPNRQGFDYFFGYLDQGHAHTYYPEFLWRNEEKVVLPNEESEPNVAVKKDVYSHDLMADDAVRYIERQTPGQPFFLYLAFTIPHANNEGGRATGDGMEVPDYGIYADKDWPPQEKGFAAMITRMDRDIGRVMDALKAKGLDENTLVIFTSDNGPHREGGHEPEFFGSRGGLRGIKRDLYEGGIRVPGIARWPGRIAPGSVSNYVWAFWDFLPTAAELAGAAAPGQLDGISIAPSLLGHPAEQRTHDFLYWEFHEKAFKEAVHMGFWKGVRTDHGPLELYNLAEDIGETHNVAGAHPQIVARIEAYMAGARTESEHWPVKIAGQ